MYPGKLMRHKWCLQMCVLWDGITRKKHLPSCMWCGCPWGRMAWEGFKLWGVGWYGSIRRGLLALVGRRNTAARCRFTSSSSCVLEQFACFLLHVKLLRIWNLVYNSCKKSVTKECVIKANFNSLHSSSFPYPIETGYINNKILKTPDQAITHLKFFTVT